MEIQDEDETRRMEEEGNNGPGEFMWCWWKKKEFHFHVVSTLTIMANMSFTIPFYVPLCEQRVGLTKSRQVPLFRQMCENAYFVTLSATEIGCLSEHDGLRVLSQRLIVCNCVRESVLVYVQHTVSDQASFRYSILEVSYSLTPLDAARVTNSIFILSPSPVSLPLSNTYSTPTLYFKTFFSLSSDLSMERERHLVSLWKTAHIWLHHKTLILKQLGRCLNCK